MVETVRLNFLELSSNWELPLTCKLIMNESSTATILKEFPSSLEIALSKKISMIFMENGAIKGKLSFDAGILPFDQAVSLPISETEMHFTSIPGIKDESFVRISISKASINLEEDLKRSLAIKNEQLVLEIEKTESQGKLIRNLQESLERNREKFYTREKTLLNTLKEKDNEIIRLNYLISETQTNYKHQQYEDTFDEKIECLNGILLMKDQQIEALTKEIETFKKSKEEDSVQNYKKIAEIKATKLQIEEESKVLTVKLDKLTSDKENLTFQLFEAQQQIAQYSSKPSLKSIVDKVDAKAELELVRDNVYRHNDTEVELFLCGRELVVSHNRSYTTFQNYLENTKLIKGFINENQTDSPKTKTRRRKSFK